ncbi:D-tagatose-1,6-bisphosphate aldolase subunit GatZ/KbaZ [Anaerobacterium chartisolvens]|uniref:D-tagatose-1,6-bisphosphate aldolase subunit GatZ/KbaZ n=1 Tax=Anaerobacterium chartisolvens TaxID=1297424 RepID=A0A369B2N0_9FIRM|nr:class II D-tagatose-bisphosphate aldolase, non-catalytic subunit [Anaerobacterium chartisolvens]RCX14828.1 D-tagatose-1,6-bisphosphate aldolase subunit GatZ/KbaZ [Anaerobacterium chartisolvens]
MEGLHPLKELVAKQKQGIPEGIYSACSANEYVIEAAMERALKSGSYVLIEATANQVNQFGGYTGMKPADFKAFVYGIAGKVQFPEEKILLGGDHLGPLTWKNEQSVTAMEKSCELLKQYVSAGFTKIHIDTSMHLADDNINEKLDTHVIAERGAILCKVAEEAYAELLEKDKNALQPVYVVGSEVPIPGGSQEEEEGIQVTKVDDFEATVETFKQAFHKLGLYKAWDNVIAVVVQPGVEFGDETIHEYNREAAKDLCNALKKYPSLVFEGHSTDYQTPEGLKEMVEDGIAILKVGPALTFALREGLFALSMIEEELFRYNPDIHLSNLVNVFDEAMLQNPGNWKKHYHGSGVKIRFARKYSFSDRCRYYLPDPNVQSSIKRLVENLETAPIPLSLLSQYMPVQYIKVRSGNLSNDPVSLLKDRVVNCVDDYLYATEAKRQ